MQEIEEFLGKNTEESVGGAGGHQAGRGVK